MKVLQVMFLWMLSLATWLQCKAITDKGRDGKIQPDAPDSLLHVAWPFKNYLAGNWTNHLQWLTSTNEIDSRKDLLPAEPICKSRSYWSQSKKEWKHLFHWEKPSEQFLHFAQYSSDSQFWYNWYCSCYANLLQNYHCCFQINSWLPLAVTSKPYVHARTPQTGSTPVC